MFWLIPANKNVKTGFVFNNTSGNPVSPRLTLLTHPGTTSEVSLYDPTYNREYHATVIATGIGAHYIDNSDVKIARSCRVEITRPENIKTFGLWYASDFFPQVVLPNVEILQFYGCTITNLSNTYLRTFKSNLRHIYINGLPMAAYSDPVNYKFWVELTKLESLHIFQTPAAITNHLYWIKDIPTLRSVRLQQTSYHGVTDLPDNVEEWTQLTTIIFDNYAQDLVSTVYERLADLPCRNISFFNCFRSTAKVDAFINETYDIIVDKSITGLSMNVRTGFQSGAWPVGEVAPPSGTYDGTTDWVGGVPTSPKAKLWDMRYNRSSLWQFDGL